VKAVTVKQLYENAGCEILQKFKLKLLIGGADENGEPKIVEIDESYFMRRKYKKANITLVR